MIIYEACSAVGCTVSFICEYVGKTLLVGFVTDASGYDGSEIKSTLC